MLFSGSGKARFFLQRSSSALGPLIDSALGLFPLLHMLFVICGFRVSEQPPTSMSTSQCVQTQPSHRRHFACIWFPQGVISAIQGFLQMKPVNGENEVTHKVIAGYRLE